MATITTSVTKDANGHYVTTIWNNGKMRVVPTSRHWKKGREHVISRLWAPTRIESKKLTPLEKLFDDPEQ